MSDFPWPDLLTRLIAGESLSRHDARAAMNEIMSGEATPAQIAGFIVALRSKGETADEMTGLVEAMYDAAVTIDVGEPVVDLVGTGGDRAGTFNISTTAAFIAAGAGVKIAKHGNRAASSDTGSADLLEALGLRLDHGPATTAAMIRDVGFGFLFAPAYHPAMRHAGPVRRELGVRSVFNFLGPMCNPARASRSAIGVSDPKMAERMIQVLDNLGLEYAFVYYGEDGLDELTTTGPSFIYRLKDGEITHAEFTPEDFGVRRSTLDEIRGGDVIRNVEITRSVIEGAKGPHRDIALVNASPAIVAGGLADGFTEAMALAAQSVDSGDAAAVLERALTYEGPGGDNGAP